MKKLFAVLVLAGVVMALVVCYQERQVAEGDSRDAA